MGISAMKMSSHFSNRLCFWPPPIMVEMNCPMQLGIVWSGNCDIMPSVMLLSQPEKCHSQEAPCVSFGHSSIVCWGQSTSASPQTCHYKTAHVLQQLVSAPGLIFCCVLVLPSQVWRGMAENECIRWMLKYRNSVQRYTVQKVIGNERARVQRWYKECEPESWNQFWMFAECPW